MEEKDEYDLNGNYREDEESVTMTHLRGPSGLAKSIATANLPLYLPEDIASEHFLTRFKKSGFIKLVPTGTRFIPNRAAFDQMEATY